ncbi:Long-chain fatty acid transport protein [Cognatiyoonia sediminum]|uniref:Long-chain fatty acid transport protein n=1 Tax=Cognatiyoonia sediminum TaxID=1508389 RepID=A0A1M5M1D8_9RHOB|nr:outer membrane protein transport protein [Cognatiyoonia sediminum]SHG71066.1 Long-chain fatty acid transport protein [Cognatiyoonia sediminum]
MKNYLSTGAALLLTATAASAGGLDRGGNSYSVLFENGNYAELSFSIAQPEVSGDYPAGLGGGSTGKMSEDFNTFGVALKFAINDQIDLGLFLNQPFGADASYGTGPYTGLEAEWDSNQIAIVGKYQVNPNVSVYGGLRVVKSEANISIPDTLNRGSAAQALGDGIAQAIAAGAPPAVISDLEGQLAAVQGAPAGAFGYSATAAANSQVGYVIGAAYEKPEIALRVSLTYESGLTHDFDTLEVFQGVTTEATTDIKLPQSLTLDFQTGVAEDTLVFGSIRWAEWSVWDVRPPAFEAFSGGAVTSLDNDTITYRLGVGRRINDDLSLFARVTYEEASGGVASRLSPTDGTTSIGIGGTYNLDGVSLRGGIEYSMLGDATDGSGVEFEENTALGLGLSVGYSF